MAEKTDHIVAIGSVDDDLQDRVSLGSICTLVDDHLHGAIALMHWPRETDHEGSPEPVETN